MPAASPWVDHLVHDDHLTVLANPACAHCVQAVERLTDMALAEGIPVAAIDVRRHPEAARLWNGATSPILLFSTPGEATRVWAGMPDAADFRALAHLR